MSYILEALKKAQAERQLGNAPTIHAPQPVQASAAAGEGLAGSRKPLLLGVGAGAGEQPGGCAGIVFLRRRCGGHAGRACARHPACAVRRAARA
jgi:hypothetical protein